MEMTEKSVFTVQVITQEVGISPAARIQYEESGAAAVSGSQTITVGKGTTVHGWYEAVKLTFGCVDNEQTDITFDVEECYQDKSRPTPSVIMILVRIISFRLLNRLSGWRGVATATKLTSDYPKVKKVRIKKLLIANRGEIACRIIRTARCMDIHTVAVYSDADRHAMHVQMADSAYNIGPPPSRESYLRADKILRVAHESGVDAIHPGYGFLSENAEFAESCQKGGVVFVGPPASAIRDMGIKSTSKAIMAAAGVPIIEGYHGEDQTVEKLRQEADRIGFPIMIKAVRGGGGKGMRIAEAQEAFLSALESARREALKAFGDDAVLLERYVNSPRHVEVQVFADQYGDCVHLFERDCSVQRRHQKVIEEAPAPGVSEQLREALGEAGVRAAQAVGYVGAGTVEFILDPKTLSFHFMEMNTRLQVEHPVTEMITGTDLVQWQIKVASGERLPLRQDQLQVRGHAFEARVYAESPESDFLPGAGPLKHLQPPISSPTVRVETGVQQGDEVSVHYDPMIAKLVVWGEDRTFALDKLGRKLAEYQVAGLDTNLQFLRRLAAHPQFVEGRVHTGFIAENSETLLAELPVPSSVIVQAAVSVVLLDQMRLLAAARRSADPFSPFARLTGFRVNHVLQRNIRLLHKDKEYDAVVSYERDGSFTVRPGAASQPVRVTARLQPTDAGLTLSTEIDRCFLTRSCLVTTDPQSLQLYTQEGVYEFKLPTLSGEVGQELEGAASREGDVSSPMPGVVDKVLTQPGVRVSIGEPLLVVIAMKMEHVIKSPREGVIERVLCQAGDSVTKNTPLVQWKQEDS